MQLIWSPLGMPEL